MYSLYLVGWIGIEIETLEVLVGDRFRIVPLRQSPPN